MKSTGIVLCAIAAVMITAIFLYCRNAAMPSTNARFVRATISWQHELEKSETLVRIEPIEVVVTRPRELESLASFFSEQELQADKPLPSIVSLATIRFVRPSGDVVSVRIYPNFGGWGSRHASWPLPPDFAPFFVELCRRLKQEQHPKAPPGT